MRLSAADPAALLSLLAERRSADPRELGAPAPPPEALQAAAELALRAPDHLGLRPVRFVHVGEAERAALGELFAQAAQARGRDAGSVQRARERAGVGPALLAVVAHIRADVDDVPPHEQWLTVGAALMNLLNALHLQGYAAKVLGGSAARSDIVRRAFCHQGEQIACWVIAGTRAPSGLADPAAEGGPAAAGTDTVRVLPVADRWAVGRQPRPAAGLDTGKEPARGVQRVRQHDPRHDLPRDLLSDWTPPL